MIYFEFEPCVRSPQTSNTSPPLAPAFRSLILQIAPDASPADVACCTAEHKVLRRCTLAKRSLFNTILRPWFPRDCVNTIGHGHSRNAPCDDHALEGVGNTQPKERKRQGGECLNRPRCSRQVRPSHAVRYRPIPDTRSFK